MSCDPHRALSRALLGMFPGLTIESSSSEPWSSNTYTGARHSLACLIPQSTWEMIKKIDEAEFSIPGHLVADIVATSVEIRGSHAAVTLGALTLEEC